MIVESGKPMQRYPIDWPHTGKKRIDGKNDGPVPPGQIGPVSDCQKHESGDAAHVVKRS